MKTINYVLLTMALAAVALVGLGCKEVNIVVGGGGPVAGPSPSPHPWPALRLLRPRPGQTWRRGGAFAIRWRAAPHVRVVRVFYSRDGGASWRYLGWAHANTGRMVWHIPHHPVFLSHNARIRIVDRDNPHNVATSARFRVLP